MNVSFGSWFIAPYPSTCKTGPRLGLAWDPTGSGRQTIRSSYSIFYDSTELNYSTHPGQGAPWGGAAGRRGQLEQPCTAWC